MSLLSGLLLLGLQSTGVADDACERPSSHSCAILRIVKQAAAADDGEKRAAPPPTSPTGRPKKAPTDGIQNGI